MTDFANTLKEKHKEGLNEATTAHVHRKPIELNANCTLLIPATASSTPMYHTELFSEQLSTNIKIRYSFYRLAAVWPADAHESETVLTFPLGTPLHSHDSNTTKPNWDISTSLWNITSNLVEATSPVEAGKGTKQLEWYYCHNIWPEAIFLYIL